MTLEEAENRILILEGRMRRLEVIIQAGVEEDPQVLVEPIGEPCALTPPEC